MGTYYKCFDNYYLYNLLVIPKTTTMLKYIYFFLECILINFRMNFVVIMQYPYYVYIKYIIPVWL